MSDTPPSNRLIKEKSPYLLQHAHNPVDWRPWGEEAFEAARSEDKPILLSIGYSTCHWCHVMERESFEDADVAALMNARFVCIKLDREEHPDIDKIYMTAIQAMTGQGGWPLNVFLSPELKPFYGGTYFPPKPAHGRPGWSQLLQRIAELWKTERAAILEDARRLSTFLEEYARAAQAPEAPDERCLAGAFDALEESFDPEHGGFGPAPKFPMPVNLLFLHRYFRRSRDGRALEMSVRTLRAMAAGGLRDQLGGGFARYSTDDHWRIPHFEKMLYDNAQLATAYLEAFQLDGGADLAEAARSTLDYVLRDMTSPEGGFYSAEDADSLPPETEASGRAEKREGAFYLWTHAEILEALGPKAGELFAPRYGIRPEGNAAFDPQGEFRGKNILYQAMPVAEAAAEAGFSEKEAERSLAASREILLALRAKRSRPSLDDKVLASWNGLMISAFAKGAQILGESRYAEAAEKAAAFVRVRLIDAKSGRLYHRWRDGERAVPGLADDYAFYVQGLIDLYETVLDARWLQLAVALTGEQQKLFFDAGRGGYFLSAADDDRRALVRLKDDSDNVEPAASSIAALNLLRLAQFTGHEEWRKAAESTLAAFGSRLREHPLSLTAMLAALDFQRTPPRQVVIAGRRGAPDASALVERVHRRFAPNKILMLAEDISASGMKLPPIDGKAAAYVCENWTCRLPVTDPSALDAQLDQ